MVIHFYNLFKRFFQQIFFAIGKVVSWITLKLKTGVPVGGTVLAILLSSEINLSHSVLFLRTSLFPFRGGRTWVLSSECQIEKASGM